MSERKLKRHRWYFFEIFLRSLEKARWQTPATTFLEEGGYNCMPTQDEMQKMAAEGEAMLIAEWIELEMNDYVMNNAQTITKRIRTAAGWTDFVYRALRDLFGRVFPGELIGIEHGPGLEAELFPPARAKRTEEGLGLGMGFGD